MLKSGGVAYRAKEAGEIRRNMSAIRSRENRTEKELRQTLHRLGFRYRKYSKSVVGKPDIVFPRERVAVFVDGDYWHGRLLREAGPSALESYYTSRQRTYWIPKLERNVRRDDAVTASLRAEGWLVLRYWETDVRKDIAAIALEVAKAVRSRR